MGKCRFGHETPVPSCPACPKTEVRVRYSQHTYKDDHENDCVYCGRDFTAQQKANAKFKAEILGLQESLKITLNQVDELVALQAQLDEARSHLLSLKELAEEQGWAVTLMHDMGDTAPQEGEG